MPPQSSAAAANGFLYVTPLGRGDPEARSAMQRFLVAPDAFGIPHDVAVGCWAAARSRAPAAAEATHILSQPAPIVTGAPRRGPAAPRYVVTLEEALVRSGAPSCSPASQKLLADRLSEVARAAGMRETDDGGLGTSVAGVPLLVLGRRWPYLLRRALRSVVVVGDAARD